MIESNNIITESLQFIGYDKGDRYQIAIFIDNFNNELWMRNQFKLRLKLNSHYYVSYEETCKGVTEYYHHPTNTWRFHNTSGLWLKNVVEK